jgi:hypothetical protein
MNPKFSSPVWVIILATVVIIGFRIVHNIPREIEVLDLYFFQIDDFGFADVSTFIWFLSFKVILIFILLFWFFSCAYWWRLVLIVPLAIELFKLYEMLDVNTLIMDETNHIYSLPLTLSIGILLGIFLWKDYRIRYTQVLLKDLDQEIDDLIEESYVETELESFLEKFNALKKEKSTLSKDEYMSKLLLLKKDIGAI